VTMRLLILSVFAVAIGCGPVGPGTAQTETATTGTSAESLTTTETTITATSSGVTSLGTTTDEPDLPTSTNGPEPGSSSGRPSDTGEGDENCDPFVQDCPPGEKCVPWGPSGWTGAKCVAITGDGAPGESCTAPEGPTAGVDDCGFGSICFDIDEEGKGTCVEQCTGSLVNPMCPQDHLCEIGQFKHLAVCFRTCDPLLAECPESAACLPQSDAFFCAKGGWNPRSKTNAPCEAQGTCDKGLACLDASTASVACDPLMSACCQPYCKLPDGPCPNPDQQCRLWYGPPFYPPDFTPPEGYEHVGVCAS